MLGEVEGIGANLAMGFPARVFYTVMRFVPSGFRMRMWRGLYQRIARSQTDPSFRFMNYGFTDEAELQLSEGDESNRLFIQLYNMNIKDVEIEGKEVLEIGSGRGGGASWIARTYNPKSLLAVDYSAEAVRLSQGWFAEQENLEFKEGNAQDLSLPDDSFDIAYNVESSHCYANIPDFLKEVFRVLRPGGKFCWTDMRDSRTMEKMHGQFLETGFSIESRADVTKNVTDALNLIDEERREMIRQSAPASLRKSFETFGGVPGTPIFEALKSGKIQYFRYLLCKPR
ncbi:MAG: methyltransferase type 11 [Euryarchaeota archaeon]|nr:methyltransferase type 11 [Euryarchaeota archaeon]